MEIVAPLAPAAVTGCRAAWTATAVRDHCVQPTLNLEAAAIVMPFDRIE